MKTTAFFMRILSWLTGSKLTVDNSVVRELDLDRFLGSWYEVARFDHPDFGDASPCSRVRLLV